MKYKMDSWQPTDPIKEREERLNEIIHLMYTKSKDKIPHPTTGELTHYITSDLSEEEFGTYQEEASVIYKELQELTDNTYFTDGQEKSD